jgi:hypothetical protein
MPLEEGLRYVDQDSEDDLDQDLERQGGGGDLETLRDELVDGFNARDMDAVMAIVSADVECPDADGDGAGALAAQLAEIWERAPGVILTRAFLDSSPCAMAWLPDNAGCWSRASLVMLDGEEDLLSLVTLVDDADALERASAEDPTGEELEEGTDWGEWDSGEATLPASHDRVRP